MKLGIDWLSEQVRIHRVGVGLGLLRALRLLESLELVEVLHEYIGGEVLCLVAVLGHAFLVVLLEEPLLSSDTFTDPILTWICDLVLVVLVHKVASLLVVWHEETGELHHTGDFSVRILLPVQGQVLHEIPYLVRVVRVLIIRVRRVSPEGVTEWPLGRQREQVSDLLAPHAFWIGHIRVVIWSRIVSIGICICILRLLRIALPVRHLWQTFTNVTP